MKEGASLTIGSGNLSLWLFIVFLVLKLTHVINWSWLWVAAPLWIGAAFTVVMIGILLVVALVAVCTRGK
jgi:hypothetical protein